MNRKQLIIVGVALLVLLASTSWAFADTGPISAITGWLAEQIKSLWADFYDFMHDLLVDLVEVTLAMFKAIVYLIPAPSFLSDFTFCALLGSAGPWTAFIVAQLRVAEAMAVLATALVFRLVRVFLTLFQWT